jgi:hypothetical protein
VKTIFIPQEHPCRLLSVDGPVVVAIGAPLNHGNDGYYSGHVRVHEYLVFLGLRWC